MDFNTCLKNRFENKICHVLGYGRSNRPLAEMLQKAGAKVTVHDKNQAATDNEDAKSLMAGGAQFVVGDGYLDGLGGDFIFRSPGLRPDLNEISAAVENGAKLTSEMELFFELCPCDIIGITGSDGKTTTTTLTHLMLKTELDGSGRGRAYVGGNIGYPLLPKMSEMSENDFAVVELSSFQLQTMKRSPRRALITNVSPNHLDWHTGMDEYIAAKRNICSHEGIELLVVNADNDVTRKIGEEVAVATTYFSSKKSKYSDIVPQNTQNCRAIYEDAGYIYVDDGNDRRAILRVSDILIPGRHNVENYMAAIALTDGLVSSETVRAVATTFKGVEHRLELVRELDGVRYYNSSIDSSPTRTQAAISALTQRPIIICGGYDKEIPFDTLAKTLCTKVKAVVLTGATADKIMAEIERCDEYSADTLNIKMIPDFKDAVLAARDLAEKGDIVLLSPACASFDAFKNFEERGNYFKDIINGL